MALAQTRTDLRVVTYNCRDWNSRRDFLNTSFDIFLIQEQWLLHDHLSALNINSYFLSLGVSGMDSSNLILGRPTVVVG